MATQTEVDAACEAIAARGERPTVERVRVKLGGGSPNALTPMVRAWKESRQQPPADAQQVGIPAEPIPLPAAIQRAIDGLSAAVAGLSPAFGVAVAEVAEVERRRSRLEVEAAVTRARAEVEEARLAVQDERETTEAVRAEVEDELQRAERAEAGRTEAELAARDAIARAAKAEGVVAGLRAEQTADAAAPKPRRSRKAE